MHRDTANTKKISEYLIFLPEGCTSGEYWLQLYLLVSTPDGLLIEIASLIIKLFTVVPSLLRILLFSVLPKPIRSHH